MVKLRFKEPKMSLTAGQTLFELRYEQAVVMPVKFLLSVLRTCHALVEEFSTYATFVT